MRISAPAVAMPSLLRGFIWKSPASFSVAAPNPRSGVRPHRQVLAGHRDVVHHAALQLAGAVHPAGHDHLAGHALLQRLGGIEPFDVGRGRPGGPVGPLDQRGRFRRGGPGGAGHAEAQGGHQHRAGGAPRRRGQGRLQHDDPFLQGMFRTRRPMAAERQGLGRELGFQQHLGIEPPRRRSWPSTAASQASSWSIRRRRAARWTSGLNQHRHWAAAARAFTRASPRSQVHLLVRQDHLLLGRREARLEVGRRHDPRPERAHHRRPDAGVLRPVEPGRQAHQPAQRGREPRLADQQQDHRGQHPGQPSRPSAGPGRPGLAPSTGAASRSPAAAAVSMIGSIAVPDRRPRREPRQGGQQGQQPQPIGRLPPRTARGRPCGWPTPGGSRRLPPGWRGPGPPAPSSGIIGPSPRSAASARRCRPPTVCGSATGG